jgi:hypothetical protein
MHGIYDTVTATSTVFLTQYVLYCLMILQHIDSGSVLLYALYIAEYLILCCECEILVYVFTASYINIHCSMYWRGEEFVCCFCWR